AALPVIATLVLLYFGDMGSQWEPARLARNRVVQSIGGLSYSLYLWHWLLFMVVVYLTLKMPTPPLAVLAIAATVLLAWLTTRFVETPLRFGPWLASTRAALWFGAATTIGIALLAVLLALTLH
ncbi:MAG: acyltransferase family protein, partial [Agromyces sp.]